MRMSAAVHRNVHDDSEECQHRKELTEPELMGLQIQTRTQNSITSENHEESTLIDHHPATREEVIDGRKNSKRQKEEEENDKIQIGRENRNGEIAAEVLEEERPDARRENPDERLGAGTHGVLADNEESECQKEIEEGEVELYRMDGYGVPDSERIVGDGPWHVRRRSVGMSCEEEP